MCEIIVVTSERRRRQDNDYSQSWRRSKSAWEESVND